jgi:hypothetical protein
MLSVGSIHTQRECHSVNAPYLDEDAISVVRYATLPPPSRARHFAYKLNTEEKIRMNYKTNSNFTNK